MIHDKTPTQDETTELIAAITAWADHLDICLQCQRFEDYSEAVMDCAAGNTSPIPSPTIMGHQEPNTAANNPKFSYLDESCRPCAAGDAIYGHLVPLMQPRNPGLPTPAKPVRYS